MGMARTEDPRQTFLILDTNAILWLYAGSLSRFSRTILKAIRTDRLLYAPISTMELEYLYERKKIKFSPAIVLEALAHEIDLQPSTVSFSLVMEHAIRNSWTRDPFDRIIVAYAQAENAPLVTADECIQKHYEQAVF